ncbi:MAG: hypothetical protein AAB038_00535, partial [Planctomycetota bacterium]
MIKSIKFLLMLGCLMALFRICPAPDMSADKNDNEKPGHNDNRDKDKEKPKHDRDKPKPSKPEEKSKLGEFSEPYKDKDTSKHGKKSSDNDTYYDDDDDGGDFWDEFWADLFSDVFSALILGDFGYRYSSYPYNPPQQPLPGIYVSTNNDTLGDMTAFQFR